MSQIKPLSGRLFLRDCDSCCCALLGAITFHPQCLPEPGLLHTMEIRDTGLSLWRLQESKDVTSEIAALSWGEMVHGSFWSVGMEKHRIAVRFIPLMPETGFFGVVGAADHRQLLGHAERWLSVSPHHCKTIVAPTFTRGEPLTWLAQCPVWPHNGQNYTLGAGGTSFRENLVRAHQLMIRYQRGELSFNAYQLQLSQCQYASIGYSDAAYRALLAKLSDIGISIGDAGPRRAAECLRRKQAMAKVVRTTITDLNREMEA